MASEAETTTINNWAIIVPKSQAQSIRQQLESLHFWDFECRLQKHDSSHIAIPILLSSVSEVKKLFPEYRAVRTELSISQKLRAQRNSPFQVLKSKITAAIQQNNLPINILEELPAKWERHGDLVILQAGCFSSPQWKVLGSGLWQLVADSLSCKRVAIASAVSQDGFRSSQVKLMLGEDGWVTTSDINIKYSFDVTKCMFSSGNITEKLRVAEFDCSDKTVVDLYAGIGYFTLPYLVHGQAAHVHACEWNPAAVEALKYNLQENGVEGRCTVHQGDNRELELDSVADVVNLGLIPSSEAGWPVAVQVLSLRGGVLHIHGNVATQRKEHLQHSHQHEDFANQTLDTNQHYQNLQADGTCDNLTLKTNEDSTEQNLQTSEDSDNTMFDTPKPDNLQHNKQSVTKELHRALSKNHNLQKDCIRSLQPENKTDSLPLETLNWSDELKPSKKDLVINECNIWSVMVKQRILQLLQENKGGIWTVKVSHIEIVKPYAPHIWHVVLDLDCRPQ